MFSVQKVTKIICLAEVNFLSYSFVLDNTYMKRLELNEILIALTSSLTFDPYSKYLFRIK